MPPAHHHPATAGAADTRSGEVVLRLTEEMQADGVADIRWLLHDALLSGARRVVVDVREVDHLSSPAAASLLSAHRACRARGGSVVVRGANRRTLDLLRRTGLWRVLGLEDLGRTA
ncbi:STAS domain-containing protein [Blastococcus sp. VKM Ac-2987]|uniref:STAS domain-containing protein n=1 Tax=Blastococcus sp. VKM Ac-2987 TaxID=3004141 RepID=UPI0022AB7D67|nr:STAS domain-containing protein [Blastococcus sp. VKM Ac-2987]MCZ2858638.1 STAS domain-containing protein [Blastococcus sp. VKM Ac-2987]